MLKNKILIVDDEMIGRQLLEAVLLPNGYEIFLAGDGFEAIEKAKAHLPDIVLMDVMMPEMDGYETVSKMKSIKELENIPVIMVTALDDRDSRIKGLEQGAIDYISKPFDRIEILTKIKNRIQEASSSSNSDSKTSSSESSDHLLTLINAANNSYTNNIFFKDKLVKASSGLPTNFNFGFWAHSSLNAKSLCLFGPLNPKEDVSFQNSLINIWISEITRNNSFMPDLVCSHIYKQMKESSYFDFEKSAWWLHFYFQENNSSIVCSGFNLPLFVTFEGNTKKKELEKDETLTVGQTANLTILSNEITSNIDKEFLLEQLNNLYNTPDANFESAYKLLINKTEQQLAYSFSVAF